MIRTVYLLPLAMAFMGCIGSKQPMKAAQPLEAPINKRIFSMVAGPGITAAEREQMTRLLVRGIQQIEGFFEEPFSERFKVHLLGSRAELDTFWGKRWHPPTLRSQCWMIASGVHDTLVMLSPKAWRQDACEHDPDDQIHVQQITTHELVHVYHDQRYPADDFQGADPIGWFVEGLATYVSGQLDDRSRPSAAEAIRLHKDPPALSMAWSGKYRYGVSGSLVAFLQRRGGKTLLKRLLRASTPVEIYRHTGLPEQQLLKAWRVWISQEEK